MVKIADQIPSSDNRFEALTPLGFRVHVTRAFWDVIVSLKHPAMAGREQDVKAALEDPDEVRRSKSDKDVYLFYKSVRTGRWVCAVAKQKNGDGFLVTAYPTDAIKEGERIWLK